MAVGVGSFTPLEKASMATSEAKRRLGTVQVNNDSNFFLTPMTLTILHAI
jgi:hypothetical protein